MLISSEYLPAMVVILKEQPQRKLTSTYNETSMHQYMIEGYTTEQFWNKTG